MAKFFIALGILFIVIGLMMAFGIKLFRLPGDIYIQKENFSFYFPITSSILLSILLSLLFYFISRFFK